MSPISKLSGHLVYEVGPIDNADDGGKTWRNKVSTFFHSIGVGVFDPTNKPLGKPEGPDFTQRVNELKREGKYSEVRHLMKDIVSSDLHMLDLASFIVAYVDPDIHTCGSYSEITYAALEKKPILIVCEKGIDKIPNWLWGICDYELFFSSFEDMFSYIMADDFSHKRWRLIDYSRVFDET